MHVACAHGVSPRCACTHASVVKVPHVAAAHAERLHRGAYRRAVPLEVWPSVKGVRQRVRPLVERADLVHDSLTTAGNRCASGADGLCGLWRGGRWEGGRIWDGWLSAAGRGSEGEQSRGAWAVGAGERVRVRRVVRSGCRPGVDGSSNGAPRPAVRAKEGAVPCGSHRRTAHRQPLGGRSARPCAG